MRIFSRSTKGTILDTLEAVHMVGSLIGMAVTAVVGIDTIVTMASESKKNDERVANDAARRAERARELEKEIDARIQAAVTQAVRNEAALRAQAAKEATQAIKEIVQAPVAPVASATPAAPAAPANRKVGRPSKRAAQAPVAQA